MVGGGPPTCGQCGKPAVVALSDVQLCVNCYHRLEVARTLSFRLNAISLNHAAEELDQVAPYGHRTPRMQVPDIPRGPFVLNNIRVDNSVVGVINTGNVESIDVNISYLKTAGSEKLSEAIRCLAEAIANERSISTHDKDLLLDQVAFLSEQATSSAQDRRPGLIKAAFKSINEAASTVTNVQAVWDLAGPLLRSVFGF